MSGRIGLGISIGGSGETVPAVAPLVLDRFTDTNGTLLQNHTPDIRPGTNPWTLTTPDGGAAGADKVVINNNEVGITLSAEGAVINAGATDVAVEMDIRSDTDGRYGIILRHASPGNFISFRVREPEEVVEFISWEAGSIGASSASVEFLPLNEATYRFRVEVSGNNYTAYIDGEEVLTWTRANHATATAHGFLCYGSALGERFDNFMVRDNS